MSVKGNSGVLYEDPELLIGDYDRDHYFVRGKKTGGETLVKKKATSMAELRSFMFANKRKNKRGGSDMDKRRVGARRVVATRSMVGGLITVQAAYLPEHIVTKMKRRGVLPNTDADFLREATEPISMGDKRYPRLRRVRRDKKEDMPWLKDKIKPVKEGGNL